VGADKIAVLSAGAVAEIGTHAELMASRGLYRRLFELEDAARPATEAP
jgi:ABC-type multidrug transport system fused ATPase/permease subunit